MRRKPPAISAQPPAQLLDGVEDEHEDRDAGDEGDDVGRPQGRRLLDVLVRQLEGVVGHDRGRRVRRIFDAVAQHVGDGHRHAADEEDEPEADARC